MPSVSKRAWSALALALMAGAPTGAFQCPSHLSSTSAPSARARRLAQPPLRAGNDGADGGSGRRSFVVDGVAGGLVGAMASIVALPPAALALVSGTPPPSGGGAAMGGSTEMEVLPREAYVKLPSGVVYADIALGDGDVVKDGSKLNVQWVLRRSNGYFVDSSAVSDSVPFIFLAGDPKGAITGLDEGVRGMRAGGKRRVLIPPKLAWVDGVDDGKPGPIPAGFGPRQQMRRVMKDVKDGKDVPGEYIFLEIKLTRIR